MHPTSHSLCSDEDITPSQLYYLGSQDDSWMWGLPSEALGHTTTPTKSCTPSKQDPISMGEPSSKGKLRADSGSPPVPNQVDENRPSETRKREHHEAFTEENEAMTDSTPESSFSSTVIDDTDSRTASRSTLVSTSPSRLPSKIQKTASGQYCGARKCEDRDLDSLVSPLGSLSPAEFMKTLWGNRVSVLRVFIIAHDTELQKLFDECSVPWLTQFQLQRGRLRNEWTTEDIKRKIDSFANKKDAQVLGWVRHIIKGLSSKTNLEDDIGREGDREQLAIEEGIGRGLGLMDGEWQGVKDWYGGKIQQIATLVKKEKGFSIQLEALEMQRSTRFARFLGSRRLIQIRLSKKLLQESRDEVIEFLSTHKFILNGRVFIPMPPKDRVCYAVETNEDYERVSNPDIGDHCRTSFEVSLEWHNPVGYNYNQPIRKYFARFALGFSNSVPVLEFQKENIHFIDDELVMEEYIPSDKKPPAEKIHTDGCGKINMAAARHIAAKINYSGVPTAIQGRIGGAKGLWRISYTDPEAPPSIWIRKSQTKIQYDDLEVDRCRCIFDLVEVSQPSSTNTCFLSQQSVLNLSANGVPPATFKNLLKEDMRKALDPLMDWSSPYANIRLVDEVERNGRVMSNRLQILSANLSRVLGHSGRFSVEESGDFDIAVVESSDESRLEGENVEEVFNGAPSSLHETTSQLIRSGFMPDESEYLHAKLGFIIKGTIDTMVQKCHIALPPGTGIGKVYVVPDPTGLLKPGQIYFRCSLPMINPDTQRPFHVLEGDVVIGRYPANLPSDLQLVQAVNIPELEGWSDVVIVPIHSTRVPRLHYVTFMTLLAGGDVDGDTVFLIFLKEIVQAFKCKSLSLPPENFETDNFEKEVESVSDFVARLSACPESKAHTQFQKISLSGLADETVGIYSHYHGIAVRKSGYNSKSAIRLAYMFNTLLDATKTGLKLRPEKHAEDQKRASRDNEILKSRGNSSSSILDVLSRLGERLKNDRLAALNERKKKLIGLSKQDPDLLRPWKEVESRIADSKKKKPEAAVLLQHDRDLIVQHVFESRKAYWSANKVLDRKKHSSLDKTSKRSREREPKSDYTAVFAPVISQFARTIPDLAVMADVEVERAKASLAFSLSEKFGFCVAFATLCRIKGEASPHGAVSCIVPIDQARSVSSGVRKVVDRYAHV